MILRHDDNLRGADDFVTGHRSVLSGDHRARETEGGLSRSLRPRDPRERLGLTEPRVVQGALECLAELGWIRPEAVRATDGGRPTVRFHLNPRLRAVITDRAASGPEAPRSP